MAQPLTADVTELAEVSVLVLGVPGCGKTALINAARGLAPTDPHAAPLEVPPAPGPPELHPDPRQPSLLLWERALVPGAEAWLAEADVVVVASAALFGPQEVAVAAAAREAGKTVLFVRTQADLALHTLRRLLGGGCEAREAALGALRQACTHALHSLGVPASPALFLICSLQPHGLDTPQLRATLLDEAQRCQRLLRPVLCDFEVIGVREAAELQEAFELGGLEAVAARLERGLAAHWATRLDIAVVGPPGTSTQPLLNVLRGLADDDPQAAPAGTPVPQPTAYPCPAQPGVVLWDLPTSTPDTLTTYDIILILATVAFGNGHMELGRVAGKHGYFIRTAEVLEEEEEAAALRQASREELAALGLPDTLVFVLSTQRPERYDFAALWEALVRALPEEQARALTLALPPLTPALVEAKRRALHAEAWKVALAASLAAAVPVPGLALSCDVPLVLDALTTYRRALGLHAAGLAGLAARSGTTLSVLRAAVHSAPGRGLSRELVQGLLGRAAGGSLGGLALELLVHRLPFCGALAAGGLTFRCTHALLGHCIEELTEDAHRVLCRAFGEPLPTDPSPSQG